MAVDTLTMTRTARSSPRAKPTPEYIAGLEVTLRAHFKEQDLQIEKNRRVREQKEIIPIPKRFQRVDGFEMNDTAVSDEIKRIVSSVNSRPPKCQVTPVDPQADPDQANASLRENWTEQVLYEAGSHGNGTNAYEQNIDACFGDGAAWCELLYVKDRWEEVWNVPDSQDYWLDAITGLEADDNTPASQLKKGKKEKPAKQYLNERENAKKQAGVPFRLRNVDVNTIYPLFRGDELVSVLEVQERPLIDLMEQYPSASFAKNGTDMLYGSAVSIQEGQQYSSPKARFLVYTNSTYKVYMVSPTSDGGGRSPEVVKTIRHGYGQVPYFCAMGYCFNYWNGRKVGNAIVQEMIEPVRNRQFLQNLVVQIAAQAAGTPIQHIRPEGGESLIPDAEQPQGETQLWDLNGLYEGQPGEKFEPIPMPGVPEAMKDLLTMLNNQIDKLQTPRVNAIGTDMSGAGFAYAQIFAEIKVSYDVYVKHLEEMYVKITRFLWKLMRDVVQETVYVQFTPETKSGRAGTEWLGAGPSDLTNGVGLRWHINADPPTAEIVLSRYWGERLQQKTTNLDHAIEKMGDNPEEVRRGQAMDEIRQEPEYKQLRKEKILQGLGAGDLMKKAAQIAAATGMGAGMPPELMAQIMAQHLGGGPGALQPMQPMGGGPSGPGGPPMQIPNLAGLGMGAGGGGVNPAASPYAGAGGPGGATPGVGQAQLPPNNGMAATMGVR